MNMTFGEALEELKCLGRARRKGWADKSVWVGVHTTRDFEHLQQPYFYAGTADGKLSVWVASHEDLLAEDWEVFA